MIRCCRILVAISIVGAALQLSAQSEPTAQEQDSQTDAETPAKQTPARNSPAAATDDPTYVLGPQDGLNINVWKEPELSGPLQVRPDGKISIPLLNDVQASGLTAMQLSANVTTGLKKYISDPHVTVIVTAINSRRVYVLGEVAHPGGFGLVPGMTVLQAIADADGLTQFAHGKRIYVLRNEGGKQVKYPFNYNRVVNGQRQEQNMELKSGDTVVVP
jgi:polysaccharide export outer membrane protein